MDAKEKNILHSGKRYGDYLKLYEAYNELLNNYNMLIDLRCFKDSSLEERKIAVERCRDKYPYTKLCEFIELPRSTYLYYHNSLLIPSTKMVSDGELKKLILQIMQKN